MASDFTAVVVGSLAVWRITHWIQLEEGPWQALALLRRFVRARGWGGPLECFYCLSLWVAGIVAVSLGRERARAAEDTTPIYHEDTEEEHVLRKG